MIETIPSKLYWLLGFLLCFFISWLFYRKEFFLRKKEHLLKWTLLSLRTAVLFMVFFLCLNPFIAYQKKQQLKPVLLVLIDNSQSLSLAGVTVDSLLQMTDQIKEVMSGKVDVMVKTFDHRLNTKDSITLKGTKTDFQETFSDVSHRYQGQNLAGMVLISDGIINSGSRLDVTPEENFPLHIVAVGDTMLKQDLVLKQLYYNDQVILGNEIPLKVEGVSSGYRGEDLLLSFYLDSQLVAQERLEINKDDFFFSVDKKLLAPTAGTSRLLVKIERKKGELTFVNNEVNGFVEVLNKRKQIRVLFDAPHPDIAAFKEVFLDEDLYELSSTSFDDYLWDDEPELIVLFGMPKEKSTCQKVQSEWSKKSSNLLFFLHEEVRFDWLKEPFFTIASEGQTNEVQVSLDPSFSLFELSETCQERMLRYPPLKAPYGSYSFSGDFRVLGVQKLGQVKTNFPLLCFRQSEARRIGVMTGRGFWRWRLQEVQEQGVGDPLAFDELLQKTVRYLTVAFGQEEVQITMKESYELGEEVVVKAMVRNSIKESVGKLKVEVSIISEKKRLDLVMNNLDAGYRVSAGKLEPGEYEVLLSTEWDGKKMTARKNIVVKEFYKEQTALKADHAFLRKLADENDGFFAVGDHFEATLQHLSEVNYPVKSYFEFFKSSLMSVKWLLYLMVSLLAVEWFLRKWYGTV